MKKKQYVIELYADNKNMNVVGIVLWYFHES